MGDIIIRRLANPFIILTNIIHNYQCSTRAGCMAQLTPFPNTWTVTGFNAATSETVIVAT